MRIRIPTNATEHGFPTQSQRAQLKVDIVNQASSQVLYVSGRGGRVYDSPVAPKTITTLPVGTLLASQGLTSRDQMQGRVRIWFQMNLAFEEVLSKNNPVNTLTMSSLHFT